MSSLNEIEQGRDGLTLLFQNAAWQGEKPIMSLLNLKMLLFAVVALAWVPAHADAQTQTHSSTTLDYALVLNGKLCIPVMLNGNVPAKLVIDTGFTHSILSAGLLEKLHLTAEPLTSGRGKPLTLAGVPREKTTVPTFALGTWNFKEYNFEVFPAATLKSIFQDKADGVLGQDFFNQYPLYIDPTKKQITFWEASRLGETARRAIGMNDATYLPLHIQGGRYTIRAHFGDSLRDDIALDTGAGTTTLSAEWVKTLNLKPFAETDTVSTVEGKFDLHLTRLPSLTLSDITVTNKLVHYVDGAPTFSIFPCLGMDILSRFRLILDVPHKQLLLEPVANRPHPNPSP